MSVTEFINSIIDSLQNLANVEHTDDINILRSDVLAVIPQLDELRTRANTELTGIEEERDALRNERDGLQEEVTRLRERNAELVSKMGEVYSQNINRIPEQMDDNKEVIEVNDLIKKFN